MRFFSIVTLILLFCCNVQAQIQGPAQGFVSSGAAVSTDPFSTGMPKIGDQTPRVRNKIPYEPPPSFETIIDYYPESSNYIEDPLISKQEKASSGGQTLLLKSFEGISQTNSIPPDPYIAVGKDHIITVVNSIFRISDKHGNTLKTINADTWFTSVLSDVNSFDPKITYDHFADRWVMVWLHQDDEKKVGYYLISVSDDGNPLGTWYNWATPSHKNGNDVVEVWGDYQGVGYDDKAIYLTSNNFAFGGSFQYGKIRIIKKSDLYGNPGGTLYWTDFWSGDINYGYRPCRIHDNSNKFYFINANNSTPSNRIILLTLNDPIGSPSITVKNVTVTTYSNAPNANQLGGGSMLIDAGAFRMRNEPAVRNGKIHIVHSVANDSYSSVRYICIDTSGTLLSDKAMGAAGYWHYYPALAVDDEDNVLITYTRSGLDEYAGAFFTSIYNGGEFTGSQVLQEGLANYVKDFGSGRNRWGDYNGAWTDPTDEGTIWISTEYVRSSNTWAVRNGMIRMKPFNGARAFLSSESMEFKPVEKDLDGSSKSVEIKNYGKENLVITGLNISSSNFSFDTTYSFPISLQSYETLNLKVKSTPTVRGDISDSVEVVSNDSLNPTFYVQLSGKGFTIQDIETPALYAAAGSISGGKIFKITPPSIIDIGAPGYSELKSLTINYQNNRLYGLTGFEGQTPIVVVNCEEGDSYEMVIPKTRLNAITFDPSNEDIYAIGEDYNFYKIDLATGDTTNIGYLGNIFQSIAINPANGELWAAGNASNPNGKDALYKINKNTGEAIFFAKTNLNQTLNDISFDGEGVLWGVYGSAIAVSNLVQIDPATGLGTLVGPITYKSVKGLAAHGNAGLSVNTPSLIPMEFKLSQNYPNPFNPSTTINISLPVQSQVSLTVYTILGEKIEEVFNGSLNAGIHSFVWNSSKLKNISSGVYIYKLNAKGSDGRIYDKSMKMSLVK